MESGLEEYVHMGVMVIVFSIFNIKFPPKEVVGSNIYLRHLVVLSRQVKTKVINLINAE